MPYQRTPLSLLSANVALFGQIDPPSDNAAPVSFTYLVWLRQPGTTRVDRRDPFHVPNEMVYRYALY